MGERDRSLLSTIEGILGLNLKEGLNLDQATGDSIAQTIKEAVDPGQLLLDAVGIFTSQKLSLIHI